MQGGGPGDDPAPQTTGGGKKAREMMPDDMLIKSILDARRGLDIKPFASAIEEATRSSRLIAERLQGIGATSALKQAMEGIRRNEELTRMAFGPLSELRRSGILDSSWRREMDLARKAMEGYQARFKTPEIAETARLLSTFKRGALSDVMAKYSENSSSLKLAMESMRTPWLDIQETMRSVAGFAEIQGIGYALRTLPAFDENLTAALRVDLGDWRDPITWRPEIFTDLAARSGFYVGLGFNPALTNFPLPAFEQSLDIAGLPRELPDDGQDDDGEEEGLSRTNGAHDCLQRLERLLRKFIDERMTQAVGSLWAKQRMPNGIYDQWRDKQRKAEEAGAEVRPLIEYADFTDYAAIICRGDNWREVFGMFFARQESVRESFQRLHPIRLDIAHSRLITQDDELLLRVEVRRLAKVMAKRKA
jgi:hypothetical protein